MKLLSGRQQFKNFCKMNSMDKRCFFEINSFGLRYLFKEWLKTVEMHKDNIVGMMGAFSGCLDATKRVIHQVLGEEIRDVQHMIFLMNNKL
jgi:hypothetical protein